MPKPVNLNSKNGLSRQLMDNWVIKKPRLDAKSGNSQPHASLELQRIPAAAATTTLTETIEARPCLTVCNSLGNGQVQIEDAINASLNNNLDKDSTAGSMELNQGVTQSKNMSHQQIMSPCVQNSSSLDDVSISETETIQPADQLCSNRRYKFQQSWFTKYKWLYYHKAVCGVLCKKCCEAITKKVIRENAYKSFTSVGFRNWKKGITPYNIHESSSQHIEAVEKLNALQQPPIIAKITNEAVKDQEISRTALECIVSSLKFLSRQGLALQGHQSNSGNFVELLRLRQLDVPELKTFLKKKNNYTSHDIQNEILKLMSHQLQRQLVQEIKACKVFSIIVDETTDIGTCEQVSINFRCVSDKLEPEELFLGLYETSSTTGEMLETIILDSLIRFGLELKNLRGQCYDGASNMSGVFKGVQSRIMQKEERAVYIHCFNHCLNLALQDTAKSVPHIKECMQLCHDLGTMVHRSPKRMETFKSLSEDVKRCAMAPRPMCPTRWTMRIRSIEPVLRDYKIMLDFLYQLSETTDDVLAKASGLYKQFCEGSTYFGLLLCKELFEPTEKLSKVLQSPKSTISGSVAAALAVVEHFKELRNENMFQEIWKNTQLKVQELDLSPIVLQRKRNVPARYQDGQFFKPQKNYNDPTSKFRDIYFTSIDLLVSEIQSRFDQPGVLKIQQIETLFLKKTSTASEYQKCFKNTCKTYKIKEARLKNQFFMFRKYIVKCNNITEIVEAYQKLPTKVQRILPVIRKLLRILLVIPASGANSERSFSRLKRIKTYLRSTMGQERLNHLCLLNAYPEKVDLIDINSIIKEFINNEHRISVFGQP